jgi:hypothetical protein
MDNNKQQKSKAQTKQRPQQRSTGTSRKPEVPRAPRRKNFTQTGSGPLKSVAVAYASKQSQTEMRTLFVDRNSCRLSGRELIGNVVGSVNFAISNTFAINPGQSNTFPKLSVQSQVWQTYRFNKLRFCYYSRTGSSTPGSITLTPDYDASDAPPASEKIAASYLDAVEDGVWKTLECNLDIASMFSIGPKKFVRTGSLPVGEDIKAYDAGNLFVVTTDGTAVAWGKIWVEYDITFFTPQLPPTGANISEMQHLSGTMSSSSLLGASPVTVSGGAIVTPSGLTLSFTEAGQFLVTLISYGTGVTSDMSVTLSGGGSFVTTFGSPSSPGIFSIAVAGSQSQITCMVNAIVGSILTYTTGGAVGSSELLVVRVPLGQA